MEAGHFQRYTGGRGRDGIPDPRGVERRSVDWVHGRPDDEQRWRSAQQRHRFPTPVPRQAKFASGDQRHCDQDHRAREEGGRRAILQGKSASFHLLRFRNELIR